MNREDCHHKTVYFGSGDYYVFCRDCPARWVTCGLNSDQPVPSISNQGVGGMLSGEVRQERLSPSDDKDCACPGGQAEHLQSCVYCR